MAKIIGMMGFRPGPSKFEGLVRPHLHSLYSAAYRFLGNTADAEDLVQDVMVKLYPKRNELTKVEKLRPWLMTVLYRTFIDRKRKSNRSPLVLMSGIKRDDNSYTDFFEIVASKTSGPSESLEQVFTRNRLQKALGKLNEDQRNVCILHDMEGYTLTELSEILSAPVGTLKSRLHRARARLRNILAGETFLTEPSSLSEKG